MRYKFAIATLLGLSLAQLASPVRAEGLAARTKPLPGITASDCIAEVDRVTAEQSRQNDRIVPSPAARKIIYEQPYSSITIACFENQVVVVIYHSAFDPEQASRIADLVLGDLFPEQ